MTKRSREPLRSLRATCEGRKEESKPVDFFEKKAIFHRSRPYFGVTLRLADQGEYENGEPIDKN